MSKYSIILATSLLVLTGCSGGSSSDGGGSGNNAVETLSTQSLSPILQSLRDANYSGASNLADLGSDKIAFTYFKNNNKHFAIYDRKKGEILSDIPQFSGGTLTSVSNNQIIFDDKTKVTVDQSNYYKKPVVTTMKSTPPSSHTKTKTPKEIITQKLEADRLHSVDIFTYTPQGHGAAVAVSSQGGRSVYFYDLDDKSYSTYYPIFQSDDDSVITEIKMLGGKYLQYTYYERMSHSKERIKVKYNFIDKYKVDNNNQNDNSNQSSSSSAKEVITRYFANNTNHRVKFFVYTPQRGGAAVLVRAESGDILYFYDLDDHNYQKRYIIKDFEGQYQRAINIEMLGGKYLQYIYKDPSINKFVTVKYNFIDKYISDTNYRDMDNNSENSDNTQNDNSTQSYTESEVMNYTRDANIYDGHVNSADGRKVLVLAANHDGIYRVYTLKKENNGLSYEKMSKPILVVHTHFHDVSVWISSVNGNNIQVGYNHKLVGNDEYITYNYINDSYVSNSTNGAGSSEYSWEQYLNDRGVNGY